MGKNTINLLKTSLLIGGLFYILKKKNNTMLV